MNEVVAVKIRIFDYKPMKFISFDNLPLDIFPCFGNLWASLFGKYLKTLPQLVSIDLWLQTHLISRSNSLFGPPPKALLSNTFSPS